jgi:heat shock protein HslJ
MHSRKNFALFPLLFSFTVVVMSVFSQQAQAQNSWLDRPLVNWNKRSIGSPQLPQPSAEVQRENIQRCRADVRQPSNTAERAFMRRGWTLYGPVYSYDLTSIVTALSGFDGSCRPLGFQAFVFQGGRFVGTLSPELMYSRTDGSLTQIHLPSATRISAEFVRYKQSDPLCCPSSTSSLTYNLGRGSLTPTDVTHQTICATSETAPSSDQGPAEISGKRWTLTEMEDRKFNVAEPYVEFDRSQNRVSGSGGCNRFSGTFEITGNNLKLSRLLSTRRACVDPERQRAETRFLQLLEMVSRFDIEGNTLRLYSNDRPVLVFVSK